MIRSLLKRTKFHRAALMLLAMLLTTPVWAEALPETKDNVEYIGENGELKTANNVTVLDADDDDKPTIGESNTETWYYVNDKEIFNSIIIKGTVNIILGDNADLTSNYIYGGADTKLNIYGTGKLSTGDTEESLCSGDISIYGGTISAISTDGPAILGYNSVNIYGGKITATSISTYNDDGIRLGWILPDDYINVSNYGGNVTILPGKEFYYNGTETFSSDKNISNDDIKGKKLQPVVASISIDGSNETIYSCLTEKESVFNRSDHDVNIKMLTDANFYGSRIVFDNNNSETEGETTHNAKITLDLNGHTLTGKFTSKGRDPNGQPILHNFPIISVRKKANVEINDLSEGKGGTINVLFPIDNAGTLSVNNVSFDLDKDSKSCIYNSGTLSVSNTKFDCENADANKVTHGIYTNENSTLNIGSGVSFSGLIYGIYTNYTEEQWRARAMTRGNETEKEPAKLYINALPVFENCMYDIYLNRSIMDFSNATAPLALASGQERITFKDYNFAPLIVFTKDYKQAFTNPTTGVITNPNDIFKYFDGEYYGETYYAFGEAIFSTSAFKLSVVTSDASGAISDLLGYSKASPDYSNSNLIAALNSLENGGTVQLFSDITGATKPYVINKGTAEDPVTLDLNGHTITGDLTVESGCKLMLIDSSNGKGHIKGAISVPVDALQNCLTNWSEKADTIKSTGSCGSSQNWSLTKNSGDKLGDNFPLKLTIDGSSYMADYSETSQDIALSTAPWAAQCSNITEISLGKNINTIGTYAFAYCNRVNEVTIPENLLYIRDNAFKGMTELKKVYIKNVKTDNALITHIDGCPFADCSSDLMINLTNANVIAAYINDYYWQKEYGSKFYAEGYCGVADANGGKNIKWSLMPINGETINIGNEDHPDNRQAYALSITKNTDDEDANLAMKESPGYGNWLEDFSHPNGLHHRIKTATIEEGIKNIGASAFASCKNLESATVPSTVTAIGEHGFSGCNKLLGINIPDGVTCIGERTFYDCNSLTSIDIPSTVTSIGEGAFYNCRSLTNIVIPSIVKNIDKYAFSGCAALKTIRVMASTPPTIDNYGDYGQYAPFNNCTSLKYIFVPDVAAYSEAYGWKEDYILPLLRADKTTLFAQDASNTYMTWCNEFEWKKPKDCTVYTVSGVNSEQVQVAEVEGDLIPAYTPVLIKRTEGKLTTDIKAEFSNVVESVSTSGTSYMNINKDTRAYQGTVIAIFDGGCVYGNTGAVLNPKNYGWVVNDEYTSTYALYSDKFLMIDADEGIPTHRFIMRVSYGDVGKARSLTIGVGGDTTGMEELKNEKIEELNSEWYDLQGRKLGSKPTRKGLYINNGKKIVIK